ncbi:Trifunctional UDP-glucose 4,6-dehydratase/UDP-4-keto-6-deoxy-D-glucose 3,5-epimerase/UDP-4-keto-L-rhamnose-reductase RHM3 [Galdieria sulphuraria]|nr:Trifunctional UDP-glucose 4,6-dehydratase/UDP-4-keto-6-deoxy-D-glucose 3,5-epimerase/UDP-4-keto-L-rhamnose-reductase RHM3 [Galdieria sulphuraria]
MTFLEPLKIEDRLYCPKRILVTGGLGFIGSSVCRHLSSLYPDYFLLILDKVDYCSSTENVSECLRSNNCKLVKGDVLSSDLLRFLLEEEQIDTVLHFAACTHVDNSFGSSLTFTHNNVLGTHVLLECCRQYGRIKRFIHVSTDEVYGGENILSDETSLLEPTNPYACTKAAAELISRGYSKSFGLPIIITRGNNVYGPCQFPDKLIPKSICLLSLNKPAFLHGSGEHKRNFLFVDDAARAFDYILHRGLTNEESRSSWPKNKVADRLLKTLSSKYLDRHEPAY